MVLKYENQVGMTTIIVDENNVEDLFEEIKSCMKDKKSSMILEATTIRDINDNEVYTMRFAYSK